MSIFSKCFLAFRIFTMVAADAAGGTEEAVRSYSDRHAATIT